MFIQVKHISNKIIFLFSVFFLTFCATSKKNGENYSIEKTEKGTSVNLDSIRFEEQSVVLKNSEKKRLKRIAEILTFFSENKLLIRGHTAFFGTEYSRKVLSERRARIVADYLIMLGAKPREKIIIQGVGAEYPVQSAYADSGRAKNRRVEVIILDIDDDIEVNTEEQLSDGTDIDIEITYEE